MAYNLKLGLNDEFRNDLNKALNDRVAKEENIQAQVNQLVINGDSSVEAAQARVNENGDVFPTLKDRIDSEQNKIGVLSELPTTNKTSVVAAVKEQGTQLAEKASKAEARLKTQKLELEDMSETTLGAMSGTATFNLLSIPQDDSVTPKKTTFLKEDILNICNISQSNYSWGTNQPTSITFSDGGFTAVTAAGSGIFFAATVEIGKTYSVGVKGTNLLNVRVYASNKSTEVVRCNVDPDGYYTGSFTATETTVYLRFWVDLNTTAVVTYAGVFLGTKYIMSYSLENEITVGNADNAMLQIKGANGELTLFNNYSDPLSIISDDSVLGSKKGFLNGNLINSYDNDIGQIAFSAATSTTYFEYFIPNEYLTKLSTGLTISLKIKSTGIVGDAYLKLYSVKTSGSGFILTSPKQTIANDGNWRTFTISSSLPSIEGGLRVYLQGDAVTTNGSFVVNDFYISYGYNNILDLPTSFALKKAITKEIGNHNTFNGEVVNFVGDSVTERNQYQPLVVNELGIVSQGNYGLSSSTLAINNTYLINKSVVERVKGINGNINIPDADIWTIFAGLNDWLYKTPLGDISSSDETTFYGALKGICENILSRPNRPTLILFTPIQSNRNGSNGATPPLVMLDYVNAIKEVGQYYSITVLDLYSVGGINPINLMYYTNDGVHPNIDYGMPLLASKIIKQFKTL